MKTHIYLGEHGVFLGQWCFQMLYILVWKFLCHVLALLIECIECQIVINNHWSNGYFK